MRISVVMPVLNEARRIQRQLQRLLELRGVYEVVVVDGGSIDGTPALVHECAAARLVCAQRGRARQMNAGAHLACGDVLLFLHADVALPPAFAEWVEWVLRNPHNVAGAFRTWTVDDTGGVPQRRWLHLADLRSRYSRLPYGDQALFVRATTFRAIGGFPHQPLMEDIEFSRALARLGRIRTVPACVQVSGRRFVRAPVRTALAMNLFPSLYRVGVPPRCLARLYGDPR